MPGHPDLENTRKLDLLPIGFIRKAHRLGIGIDREYFHALTSRFGAEMRELEKDIANYIPRERLHEFAKAKARTDDDDDNADDDDDETDFNANSHEQISKLLFEFLDIGQDKKLKRTDKGKVSANKKQLELVKWDHPIVPVVLRYKKLNTLITRYTDALPQLAKFHPRGVECPVCELPHSSDQWRVHGEMGTTRADTGRINHKNPNLGTVPVRSEDGRLVQAGFVAPEGMRLVTRDLCVAPDTKILTADLRWLRADTIRPGDKLIGFNEDLGRSEAQGHGSKFCESIVETIKIVKLKAVRINTDQGSIVTSLLHPFVVRRKKPSGGDPTRCWVKASELAIGDKMAFTCKTWREDQSRSGGYLSGVFDGEGYISAQLVAFGQRIDSPVYAETIRLLEDMGFRIGGQTYRHYHGNQRSVKGDVFEPVGRIHLAGMWQSLRFLGSLRPVRLLPKARELWENGRTWSQHSESATVDSIETVGERFLIAIQTSTSTYISNGFLSHNSQIELRDLAHLANAESMIRIYNAGGDIHDHTARQIFKLSEDVKPDKYNHRLPAKRCSFSIVNGSTEKGLYMQLVTDYGENQLPVPDWLDERWCGDFIVAWLDAYPEVRDYFELQYYRARRYGRVWEPMGRVKLIPEVKSVHSWIRESGLRQAQNMPITAFAASQLKLSMGATAAMLERVRKAGVWAWELLSIHDAILEEVEEDAAEDVLEATGECMDHCMDDVDTHERMVRVPIESDGEVMWDPAEGVSRWKKAA